MCLALLSIIPAVIAHFSQLSIENRIGYAGPRHGYFQTTIPEIRKRKKSSNKCSLR